MNILLVDNDPVTLQLLKTYLVGYGHLILTAQDGKQAMAKLKADPVDMVISDWMMPETDGPDLCAQIRNYNFKRYIYIILISAQNTQDGIIRGLKTGADDYITKPVNLEQLHARVEIGKRIIQLEKELFKKNNDIKKNYIQTIRTFTNLLEIFNEDLGEHCRRVGKLALKLAKHHPDISEEDFSFVESAGLLHDIGMVGLPNKIISKKRTQLNGDEKQLYLSHPARGEIILKEIEFLQPVAKLVRSHHEQFNGRGFPDGLKGDKIPLLAKIVSAASIYDNLVHRGKIHLEDIPGKLQQLKGYQLDPAITDFLLEINLENIQAEKGKNYLAIPLNELKDKMMLAKNIRMKSGAIVLPVHTDLSSYEIEKLNKYYEMGFISHNVHVFKHSIKE